MRMPAFGLAVLLLALATARPVSAQQVELRAFMGGQHRPDVVRSLLKDYMAANPGVKVTVEVGGATSELHQRYLSTVLTARDESIDAFLIDIIRPAQFAAAGWAEPLDAYLGDERDAIRARYLEGYRTANTVNGKTIALPGFADAMFLYYRKDLLEKYGEPVPTTWPELARIARKILDAERDPNLQGLSFQGKAVEGAVCTFLLPYWSLGGEIVRDGKMSFDRTKAEASLNMWRAMVDQGIAKRNIAEVGTDDTRKEFQAGRVLFAINWGYAWNHFQTGADTRVAGKVGVVRLPAMPGGKSVTCSGGWSWAVSAFSRNKAEAAKLVRYLTSPAVAEQLAIRASQHPAMAEVYADPDVLKAVPWFADALPVIETAYARPVTPMYRPISDALRINFNTVMAGVRTPREALDEIEHRIKRALR
ncbi:MAG: ABC transporter substrate-binding protein [Nitrosomonadaceae bacterium]|jgi:multiple sugar transport system substrate-binding protein|nr:ABC transporter substrate-binding protein [Nitrosomonadaceae bacterium]